MSIITDILNRAAFYKACGAKLTKVDGYWPQSTFTLEVPRWILFYEKYIGWVKYRKYCTAREALKEKSKEHTKFLLDSNNKTGFNFLDIAKAR